MIASLIRTALSQRLDADEVEGADRANQLKNGSRMIDDGIRPDPQNFVIDYQRKL